MLSRAHKDGVTGGFSFGTSTLMCVCMTTSSPRVVMVSGWRWALGAVGDVLVF